MSYPRKIFVGCGFALLFAAMALGQMVNGTILGTVTDTSGAVIAGAKITLTEVNTKIGHTGTTNASGDFSFPDLAARHLRLWRRRWPVSRRKSRPARCWKRTTLRALT